MFLKVFRCFTTPVAAAPASQGEGVVELPVLKRLKQELANAERELRVEVPKELRTAAAHGDLRENAEYEAAKSRQFFLHARVRQFSARISALTSLSLNDIPHDAVGFGSRVYLDDLSTGDETVYEIVTPEEVDARNGKISASSPIGRALLNKSEGDDVTMNLPGGVKQYGVVRVETLHDLLGDDCDKPEKDG